VNDFRAFLLSLGLQPGNIVADGQWHRCPTDSHERKKNGAWKLSPDGRIGWGQDHAAHAKPVTWKPEGGDSAPMPFDPEALRLAHAESRRKQVAATQAAREFYRRCEPLMGGHPYLESHGLGMEGCFGLKIDRDGWLVVPAYRGGNLMTVQRISPDGDKRFWPGAPVKGAAYTIERRSASVSVLTEGLATGLALYAAAPLTRVLVAFNSGNMGEVQMPNVGMIAVAGDNDWKTVCKPHREEGLTLPFKPWDARPSWCLCNPGRKAAEAAANAVGCGFALPQGIQGTDWCDYRTERLAERFAARERDPFSRERDSEIRRGVDAEIAAAVGRVARLPINKQAFILEGR
jgi:putative DNA primase/helicase